MKNKLLTLLFMLVCGLISWNVNGQPVKVSKSNSLPVYMHYMPWFETPETSGSWGYHWTMRNRNPNNFTDPSTGRRDIASHYYPLIGPYGSSDPDVIEYHLLLMKLSGVDGVLIDWYGVAGSNGDISDLLRNSNALINRTDETGMKFGLVLEDRFTGSVSNAKANIGYAHDVYFNKPEYIRHGSGNDPLLAVFGPITFQQPWQWSDILSSAGEDVEFLPLWYESGEAGGNADGEYMWIYQDNRSHLDHLSTYYSNRAHQMKTVMGVAYPGFHDFYAQGGAGSNMFYIPHNGGATLDQTFALANQYRGSMEMLQLATFNDFGEGTMFEPTRETGFSYLVKLQKFTGVPYSEYELQQVLRLYNLRKQYKHDGAKQSKLNEAFNHFVALRISDAVTALNCVESGSCNPVTYAIPGTIQAENYSAMSGIQTEGTTDNGGGLNIGWIDANYWTEYNVNVTSGGSYNVSFRVASASSGGQMQLRNSSGSVLANVLVPVTGGWQNWTTVNASVNLTAGTQKIRLQMLTNGFNINWVNFEKGVAVPVISSSGTATGTIGQPFSYQITASNSPTSFGANSLPSGLSVNTSTGLISGTPASAGIFSATVFAANAGGTGSKAVSITINSTGSTHAIPGTIQAESFSSMSGIQLENTTDGGGQNVGWIDGGDWLDYSVNVVAAGSYTVEFRVASSPGGGGFELRRGSTVLASRSVSSTGGWQNWITLSSTVSLNAGSQTLRLYATSGGWNVNWIKFSQQNNCSPTTIVPYLSVNGGTWQQTATATLNTGGMISLGPDPITGGSWSWSGPNGFTSSSREISISNIQTSQGGNYVATFTNPEGCLSTQTYSITVQPNNSGGTRYRIRNRWQNTYLYDAGDRARYSSSPSVSSYEWILEDVGGGNIEIKNAATEEYLHIENRTGYVQCTPRTSGWSSSRWAREDAGSGYVRVRNVWQSNNYIHVENLQGHAQHGTINQAWWSAHWIFESVSPAAKTSALIFDEKTEGIVEEKLTIVPNPVQGENIKIIVPDMDGEVTVEINDQQGALIVKKQYYVENKEINLGLLNLTSGIYILRINQNGKQFSDILMVE